MLTGVALLLPAFVAGYVLARTRSRRDVLPRGRRSDEATFTTLHIAALAAPALRAGLGRDSARKAVRHLRTLLGTHAVAITSAEAVLAWDGPPCGDVLAHARATLAAGRAQVFPGEPYAAVVVPLTVDGAVVGTLAAHDDEVSSALVRTVTEVGRWVSGQLELADLDASRQRALEAEMRALRAQISPHFIYNALTTIASFVRTNPRRARELLLDFADFARYALRRANDFTTLADELACVDRYLLLERARFGDKLRFSVQVAPEVLPVPVPFLCLQPLVENAIKHGMRGNGGAGEVRVVVRDAGPEAHITVEDDGAGMDPECARRMLDEEPAREGGGIGLANVDLRMRQIYGDGYGLVVETALGAGTKVRLCIPKTQLSA
ncbi:sensor histidine kinase [Nonomuraea sp. KC401]|uniref:sensor histidine kinase n=1 Tax=unclassified Nonomuraea TaxID=2593643 RepID=UPI0010FD4FBB|nr:MULTISPECIES: histidine kinase [unclassified Nonomuraea]NBE99348.1 sensor histidine kinase [Nonomuraea sp. K271]TLF54082.1 sensor histidine kinase [Nonomuraea sp. KC401]